MKYVIVDLVHNKGVIIGQAETLSGCKSMTGESIKKVSKGFYESTNYHYFTVSKAEKLGFKV